MLSCFKLYLLFCYGLYFTKDLHSVVPVCFGHLYGVVERFLDPLNYVNTLANVIQKFLYS